MKTPKQKKVKISITLSNELVKILNDRTNNKSNYIEHVLRLYYYTLGENVSKIII